MKSISTINPATMENTECLIGKVHTLIVVYPTLWIIFQAKNTVRSSPASTALLHSPKFGTEAIMRVPQIITYIR